MGLVLHWFLPTNGDSRARGLFVLPQSDRHPMEVAL
jgi:hypothetical protein